MQVGQKNSLKLSRTPSKVLFFTGCIKSLSCNKVFDKQYLILGSVYGSDFDVANGDRFIDQLLVRLRIVKWQLVVLNFDEVILILTCKPT